MPTRSQENSKPVRSPSNRSSIPFGMAKLRRYPCGHNYINRWYVRSMSACMYVYTSLSVPSPPRLRTSEAREFGHGILRINIILKRGLLKF
jgi:hypothetical protein